MNDMHLGMTLGRLLEASETTVDRLDRIESKTVDRLDRIDSRLVQGDHRMASIERDVHDLKKLRKDSQAGSVSSVERWAKVGSTWVIPGGVLWYTGSIEAALKVLQALAGAAK